jgi:hypothetical protein
LADEVHGDDGIGSTPLSVCTRQDGGLTVKVSLESADGNTSYASTSFSDIGSEWRRHEATLTVSPQVRCIDRDCDC